MAGLQQLIFVATVSLQNGRVSKIIYSVWGQFRSDEPIGWLIHVESFHGQYPAKLVDFEVATTDDESPQYRIHGDERDLEVFYSLDAPHELTSHASQLNLSCFWCLQACRDVRKVAPLIWRDKQAIDAAALARLKSNDPYPDRIVAARLRYLVDLSLFEVEITSVHRVSSYPHYDPWQKFDSNYRVIAPLYGPPGERIPETLLSTEWIFYPPLGGERIPNPERAWSVPGRQVLMFAGGYDFDSCATVPVTPSALSTVQSIAAAPKLAEDEPPSMVF